MTVANINKKKSLQEQVRVFPWNRIFKALALTDTHKDTCMENTDLWYLQKRVQSSGRAEGVTVIFKEKNKQTNLSTNGVSSLWRKGKMNYAKVYKGNQELSNNQCSTWAGIPTLWMHNVNSVFIRWTWVNTAVLSTQTDTILREITGNMMWQAWNLTVTLAGKMRATSDESGCE